MLLKKELTFGNEDSYTYISRECIYLHIYIYIYWRGHEI